MALIRTALDRMGGWPMIDDNWDESQFDIETAIVESIKLVFTSSFLNIRVIKDLKNNSQPIIAVKYRVIRKNCIFLSAGIAKVLEPNEC